MSSEQQRLEIKLERLRLQKEVYEMIRVHHQSVREVMKKTGLKKGTVYHYLYTFESDNPQVAEQMKKRGSEITPDDYKKLQEENARLLAAVKHEKLRADFNAEMVAFYEETYGISSKKAGTK